jgi:hypothetical protein
MNDTEFKIVDAMSRRIGNAASIRRLTSEIGRQSGTAYYPNIYRALVLLKGEKIVRMEKQGKASIPTLNFANYLLPDILTEMELQRKREFLRGWPEAGQLFESLERGLGILSFIESILLLSPQRNTKLNRAELLVLMDERSEAKRERVEDIVREIRSRLNVRIECLVMTGSELIESLRSHDKNPIKEMLSDKIVMHMPQSFWKLIREAIVHGVRIEVDAEQTNPAKIGERDLAYNLARLGYRELGPKIDQGEDISVEYITASILLGEDKRRIAAVPVLLAKNKPNYGLLAFLSQRFSFSERLLGLLIALHKIVPAKELEQAISTLRSGGFNPIKMDESHIRQTMRLYGIGT